MGIAYDLNVSLGVDEGSDQCPSTYSSYLHLDFNLYLALSFFFFYGSIYYSYAIHPQWNLHKTFRFHFSFLIYAVEIIVLPSSWGCVMTEWYSPYKALSSVWLVVRIQWILMIDSLISYCFLFFSLISLSFILTYTIFLIYIYWEKNAKHFCLTFQVLIWVCFNEIIVYKEKTKHCYSQISRL